MPSHGQTVLTAGVWKTIALDEGLSERNPEFHMLSGLEELTVSDVKDFDIATKSESSRKRSDSAQKNKNKRGEPETKKSKKLKKSSGTPENDNDAEKDDPDTNDQEEVTGKERKRKKPKKKAVKKLDKKKRNEGSWSVVKTTEASSSISAEFFDAWNDMFVPPEIMRSLSTLGFQRPTEIQRQTIPLALRDGVDILGAAETGSGKTLAFGIPIVGKLLDALDSGDESLTRPFALILSPTRELAVQIKSHILAILPSSDIKVSCIIGGLSADKQTRLIKRNPHIIIATPGRLWDLMQQGHECLDNLHKIRCLAIDETDRMVEKGHFADLESILGLVQRDEALNKKRQNFVFSATLTFVHPPPRRLLGKRKFKRQTTDDKIAGLVHYLGLRPGYKVVDITEHKAVAHKITEARMNCDSLDDKDAHLYYFLYNFPGRTLIFTNSVDGARRLHNILLRLGFAERAFLLHAKMHQKQRLKNLERFSELENSILLATDVAARGLDIKKIKHILHYQVPRTSEIYIHRSGRTARAEADGLSLMLVDAMDAACYQNIITSLNRDTDLPSFPVDSHVFNTLKQRVKLATQIERQEHQDKRTKSKEDWFRRQAQQMDIDFEDDEV